MTKYLFHASYTVDGLKGLLREGGTSRRSTIDQLVKGMGGSMEAFYYAFGENDVIAIADFPDDAGAAALSMAINASGAVKIRTTVLITPETMDTATKKTVDYRPPGK